VKLQWKWSTKEGTHGELGQLVAGHGEAEGADHKAACAVVGLGENHWGGGGTKNDVSEKYVGRAGEMFWGVSLWLSSETQM